MGQLSLEAHSPHCLGSSLGCDDRLRSLVLLVLIFGAVKMRLILL